MLVTVVDLSSFRLPTVEEASSGGGRTGVDQRCACRSGSPEFSGFQDFHRATNLSLCCDACRRQTNASFEKRFLSRKFDRKKCFFAAGIAEFLPKRGGPSASGSGAASYSGRLAGRVTRVDSGDAAADAAAAATRPQRVVREGYGSYVPPARVREGEILFLFLVILKVVIIIRFA